jgi:hypothetical protein
MVYVSFAIVAGLLSGCAVQVQSPQPAVVYAPPPPVAQPAPEYIPPPPAQPPVEYVTPAPAPVYLPAPAPAPEVVIEIHTESDFYQPLQSYGRWIDVPGYGRCWTPAGVDPDWHPYTDGQWQRTDAGWYWVSDEPWGWATCHYGRWHRDDSIGWVWIPQTQWAPAWVAWRDGGGYTGWAPLPPEARVRPDGTFDNRDENIDPRSFAFVEQRRMLEPHRHHDVIVNNTTIINKTVNITKIVVVNKTIINEGPRPDAVEQATGRKVDEMPAHTLRIRQEAPAVAEHRNHAPAPERDTPPGITPAHNHAEVPVTREPVVRQTQPVVANPTTPQSIVGRPHEPVVSNEGRPSATDAVFKPTSRPTTPGQPVTQPNQLKPESGQIRTEPHPINLPVENRHETTKPETQPGQLKTEAGQPLRQTVPGQMKPEQNMRPNPATGPAHEPAKQAPASLTAQQKLELEQKRKTEAKRPQEGDRRQSQSSTNAPVPTH